MIDSILFLAATTLRFIAAAAKKKGLEKLALELEATAAKTDAFRTDPVYKVEIDSLRLQHTWGDDVS